jgi:phasin family protein
MSASRRKTPQSLQQGCGVLRFVVRRAFRVDRPMPNAHLTCAAVGLSSTEMVTEVKPRPEEKTMFTNPEQFASATKTLFDLQMQTFNALASKAVQGVEQVVALNMSTARNTLQNTMDAGRAAAQATDPKAAADTLSASMKPDLSGANAYGEQMRQILGDIQNEFQQAADAHLAEAKNTLSALIFDITQNVKPGQENAVEIIKASIENVFKGYEQVTSSTREAMRRVEEQVARASSNVPNSPGDNTGG